MYLMMGQIRVLKLLFVGMWMVLTMCCCPWFWLMSGPAFDDTLESGDFVVREWSNFLYCGGNVFKITSSPPTDRGGVVNYKAVCVAKDGSTTEAGPKKRILDVLTGWLPVMIGVLMTPYGLLYLYDLLTRDKPKR